MQNGQVAGPGAPVQALKEEAVVFVAQVWVTPVPPAQAPPASDAAAHVPWDVQ
jgi:hypothetical protein